MHDTSYSLTKPNVVELLALPGFKTVSRTWLSTAHRVCIITCLLAYTTRFRLTIDSVLINVFETWLWVFVVVETSFKIKSYLKTKFESRYKTRTTNLLHVSILIRDLSTIEKQSFWFLGYWYCRYFEEVFSFVSV